MLVVSYCMLLMSVMISQIQSQNRTCRLSSLRDWVEADEFQSYACGECFFYIFGVLDDYRERYFFFRCKEGVLICEKRKLEENPEAWTECSCGNPALVFNLPEYSLAGNWTASSLADVRLDPPLPSEFLQLTQACCAEALDCCTKMIAKGSLAGQSTAGSRAVSSSSSNVSSPKEGTCPMTWDGWQCFLETANSTEARGICPWYIYNMPKSELPESTIQYLHSTKRCLSTGHWYITNQSNSEWTDYTPCAAKDLEQERAKLIVSVVSFSISVISIIPAFIIFSSYRALQIEAITVHKHLLASFLLNGAFYIFNTLYFVFPGSSGEHLVSLNDISCRILFTVQMRYLRLTNYLWMLCEGLYLHRLLIAAFEEHYTLITFYLLGWVFPVFPTIVYSVFRAQKDDTKCWITPMREHEWAEWVIKAPCLFSLAVNLVLMIGIVYILIRKLQHSPHLEPVQYRKAVRATVMLLPVFGAHFFITVYRAPLFFYTLLNLLLDGLQGFFVVMIICYTNGRVLEVLKTSWRNYRYRCELRQESMNHLRSYHRASQILVENNQETILTE